RDLRQSGVGPETLVGVYMQRSLEIWVSLLAVLKAGGAYLPLDPALPSERIDFMLQDCGIRLTVAPQHVSGRLSGHNLRLVDTDRACDDLSEERGGNLGPSSGPDHLAYAMFTSGSTG